MSDFPHAWENVYMLCLISRELRVDGVQPGKAEGHQLE